MSTENTTTDGNSTNPRKRNTSGPINEIDALGKIQRILNQLPDDAARRRTVNFLADKVNQPG